VKKTRPHSYSRCSKCQTLSY